MLASWHVVHWQSTGILMVSEQVHDSAEYTGSQRYKYLAGCGKHPRQSASICNIPAVAFELALKRKAKRIRSRSAEECGA